MTFSEAQARAWLKVRIDGFLPRIKKLRKTKNKNYEHTLHELYLDLRDTLEEFKRRTGL